MTIEINHAAYEAKVATMTDAALLHTMRDAREAVEAMPDGPKAGYYLDEINYCASELNLRRRLHLVGPRVIDAGNNETITKGAIIAEHDGTFTAVAATASKRFKTRKGAEAWLARRRG
jgi:hypothetical protein